MLPSRAIFTPVVDHLEMKSVPIFFWEMLFEIILNLDHIFTFRTAPPFGKPPDMGIDGKSGLMKRLAHDYGRGFMSYPWKRLKCLESGGHLPMVPFDQQLR